MHIEDFILQYYPIKFNKELLTTIVNYDKEYY